MHEQYTDRAVRFAVRPLRRAGRRLPWREAANAAPVVGELLTHVQTTKGGLPVRLATLRDPAAPVGGALLPDLYEPVLVLVGPRALRLRGIEGVDGRAVVQEWYCEAAASEGW